MVERLEPAIEKVSFLGTHFHNTKLQDALNHIAECVDKGSPGFMCSLNTDIAIKLNDSNQFRQSYNMADLALMDSQVLIKLALKQGIPVKDKISGSDLMPKVCEMAAKRKYSIFILGGKEGVPEKAAKNMISQFPNLRVKGVCSPPFGFENHEDSIAEVIKAINTVKPDILFVCLGAPKSEEFIAHNIENLAISYALCVGAAVDFAAGTIKRAPKWMQDIGLEWFYRFTQEPRRLFHRYFVDSIRLLPLIFRKEP